MEIIEKVKEISELMNELQSYTNNHLNNKYKNRIYTEEEIKELIGV